MNTNETIEYEIPTEGEWDVSVQGAERRGIRIGIEKMRDALLEEYDGDLTIIIEVATKLLVEQGEKE